MKTHGHAYAYVIHVKSYAHTGFSGMRLSWQEPAQIPGPQTSIIGALKEAWYLCRAGGRDASEGQIRSVFLHTHIRMYVSTSIRHV